jgi:hypothetical protein
MTLVRIYMISKNINADRHDKLKVDRIVEWFTTYREMCMVPCAAIQWTELTFKFKTTLPRLQ